MKRLTLTIFLFLLVISSTVSAQSFSSVVEILTVYSENGEYYLRSVPWDNESPSIRGTTSVYRKGINEPLYSFDVGFDTANRNLLTLSNNGKTILYFVDWMPDEKKDGFNSVNVYKTGQFTIGYSMEQLTGCDSKKERCSLIINNYDDVVDLEKTATTGRRVYRSDISEIDKFLRDFPLFTTGDTVYLTDSKRQVHEFDLNTGEHKHSAPFDPQFAKLKSLARANTIKTERYESLTFIDFPKLRSSEDTYQALAKFLGMKVYDSQNTKDEKYKKYAFEINSYLTQEGLVEVEDVEIWGGELPKEKILEFFRTNRFDSSSIPTVFKKWHLRKQYFFFRKADDALARKERREELRLQRAALEKRLVAEKIDDVYIPKSLVEAFIELDKTLPEVSRNEMASLKSRKDMITYHHGLGTWLRNNWGLWGGSRLQKYFTDKGIVHPDDMSSIVLLYYWDWLKGNKDSWKEWEKNPKQKIF